MTIPLVDEIRALNTRMRQDVLSIREQYAISKKGAREYCEIDYVPYIQKRSRLGGIVVALEDQKGYLEAEITFTRHILKQARRMDIENNEYRDALQGSIGRLQLRLVKVEQALREAGITSAEPRTTQIYELKGGNYGIHRKHRT